MAKNTLSSKAGSNLGFLNKVIGEAKRKKTREPESDYGETFRDYGLLGVAAKATYRAVTGQPIRKQKSKKGADFDNSDFFNRIRDIYNDELQLNVPTLIENALENPTGTFKRETYVLNQKLDRLNDTAIEIKNLLKNKDKAAGAGAGEEDDSTIWDDMFGGDDIDIDIDRRRRRRPRGRGRGRFGRGVRGLGRGIGRMFGRGGAAVAAGVAGGAAAGVVGKNAAQVAAEAMGKSTATQVAETGTKAVARESLEAGVKTTAKKNLGSIIAKVVGPKLASTAAKAIPGVGLVTGLGFGVYRYLQGDTTGAAAEIASGAASTIPLAGTAASLVGSVGLAARDVYKEMYGVFPEEDDASVRDERMTEIKDEVTNYVKGFSGTATETGGNPAATELRKQQAEEDSDQLKLEAQRTQDMAARMGILSGDVSAKLEGGVPTVINGKPVPDELYTDEQREKIKMAREMRASMNGNADLPAVGASPISGTVNGFPIPGGQPSAPISETAAEKSKDPVLVIPTALAAGTYYLTTDKPTRTMDVTTGISRAMSVGGVGGRASGSMSMASGTTATGKAGALPTATPAGITPSVTVPSATPAGGGGGGAIAPVPQAMTTGQQLSQMTQQSAPSRGGGAAPSAMGTGGGGVVTGDTISARTGPMTSVTRGPSRGAGQTAATAPSAPTAKEVSEGYAGLGSLSATYESGKKGSSAVGFDSTGGTSFGKYQIATRTGTMNKFLEYAKENNPEVYERLKAAGNPDSGKNGAFAQEWKNLVAEGKMGSMEHDFIKASHYDVAMGSVKDESLKKMINDNPALQDVMWSTSVQHGPGQKGGASGIFNKVYKPGMTSDELIREVYAERRTKFGSSTANVQASVQARFTDEERRALAMNANPPPNAAPTATASKAPSSDTPAPTATEAKGQMSDEQIKKIMDSPEQVKPGEETMAASEIKKGFESTTPPPDAPKAAAAPVPTPNPGRAIPSQARAPDPMQQMMGMVQTFMGGQGGMPNTTQPTPLPKGIGDFAFRKGEMPWGMSKTMSRDSQGVTTMFDPAGGAAGIFAGGGQEAFQ